MPNKPSGRQCVNVSTGKVSHLLIKKKGPDFPAVADPANPQLGDIIGVSVSDDENGFFFNATAVAQTNKKRLALRLVSALPGGGADPLDGLLTITLQIVASLTPLTTSPTPVADAPVDYVSDPAAP